MDSGRRHKSLNDFQFKSFAELVNKIDIRRAALYYIGHSNEISDITENETYFHEALQKWSVLNFTSQYISFQKKCSNIVTLPQLFLKKDFVINLLLEELEKSTIHSVQPFLEILVVLARDLREEFYPYFSKIMDKLILLLDTTDAEQLEWTLICLAYLFKILKPFLKKNINEVLEAIFPLLDEDKQPAHVTKFAVQCFAYVARDIKDKERFLTTMLGTISKYSKGIIGCAQLLTEILCGVSRNFHSNAGEFLETLFLGFFNKNNDYNVLFQILENTTKALLDIVYECNMQLFWDILLKIANVCFENCDNGKHVLKKLLYIIKIMFDHNHGKYIHVEITIKIILLCYEHYVEEEILELSSELITKILLSHYMKLSQLDSNRLISKVLLVDNAKIYGEFVKNMCLYPQYDILIFPKFLKYFENNVNRVTLKILTEILIRKSPPCENGSKTVQWRKSFPFELMHETKMKLKKTIDNFDINSDNFDEFCMVAYIWPNICSSNDTNIEMNFISIVHNICAKLKLETNTNQQRKLILLLHITVESLVHIDSNLYTIWKDLINTNLLYCNETHNLAALRILNMTLFHINSLDQSLLDYSLFEKIREKIAPFLSDMHHNIREITAHTLSIFSELNEFKSSLHSIYKIFYDIEIIQPSVHTYRDQLILLRLLSTDSEFYTKTIAHFGFQKDCLHFMCGLLHNNFSLLWDPVINMIEQYYNAMDVNDFWDILKRKLETITEFIKQYSKNKCFEIKRKHLHLCDDNKHTVINMFKNFSEDDEHMTIVSLLNYRILLLKVLSKISYICEIKNRDIVIKFLDFYLNEYKKKVKTYSLLGADSNLTVEYENLDLDEDFIMNNGRKTKTDKDYLKKLSDTLVVCLEIFSNMKNPKQLYQTAEIYNIYEELLQKPNDHLQKLALNCIMTYNNKSLNPYKEHFYRLIDEKTFKDEIVNFKINRDSLQIQSCHRKEVLQLILKILYGKMYVRTGLKKSGVQTRKNIVLKYIADCENEEIFCFINQAFMFCQNFIQVDILQLPDYVNERCNLESMWSPKKLNNAINLLEIIQKQFGGLMDYDLLHHILKIIIFIGCVCEKVLITIDSESNGKLSTVFKNLRSSCIKNLNNFFEHFHKYKWKTSEINIILNIFIWPVIDKLSCECLHSPTPILKLLATWSCYSKYNYVFAVKNAQNITVFNCLIKLLQVHRAKIIIHDEILDIVERLLHNDVNNEIKNDTTVLLPQMTGISIIQPYVELIIGKLQMNLNRYNKFVQKNKKRDLFIISQLVKFVSENDTSYNTLDIILSTCFNKVFYISTEDETIDVIKTIFKLIEKIDCPEKYLRNIGVLFEKVHVPNGRKILCELLDRISKITKNSKLAAITNVIKDLNAWNMRWLDQPDYDKRFSALRKLSNEDINDMEIDIWLIILHNCLYIIRYDNDIGMRENCKEYLQVYIPKMLLYYESSKPDVEYVISNVFLNFVREILRQKKDNVLNDCLQILGKIASDCAHFHIVLSDLNSLTDKADKEVDFFENIVHLQSHRQSRALLKFCSVANKEKKAMNIRTLTHVILPLTSKYLLNENFVSKHNIVDAAIETVGVVCKYLPWYQYQLILKHYLQKMRINRDYHKQCVRIVVVILDAFHFDLKRCKENSVNNSMLKRLTECETNADLEKQDDLENDHLDNEDILDSNLDTCTSITTNDLHKKQDIEIYKLKSTTHMVILSPSVAKRILNNIENVIIPNLNSSITELSNYESKHKLNRRKRSFDREEEEMLRIPIALAVVKLLQKLPDGKLESNISKVFLNVCNFLRSPLKSTRMLARDILKKILQSIGAHYLPLLLAYLSSLLTRGFQIHVLTVTVHGILDTLKNDIKSEIIEKCLQNILDIAINDIFGDVSNEKEINKILTHTPEAKPSKKSYLILQILSKNIGENCMIDLIMPLKKYLIEYRSKKVIQKIKECLKKIVNGLADNKHISVQNMLIFIHGLMSKVIDLTTSSIDENNADQSSDGFNIFKKSDCFLIAPEPRKSNGSNRKWFKTDARLGKDILKEFGLELLYIILKRKKAIDIEFKQFLNPLVAVLEDSLNNCSISLICLVVKCITVLWNYNYDLEEMKQRLDNFVSSIFLILRKYYTNCITKKDENYILLRCVFKSVIALLVHCEYYTFSSDNLTQLIFYIEQDIHSSEAQPLGFSILKAIVSRKYKSNEIDKLMKKICEMCISSKSKFVNEECRIILLHYVFQCKSLQKLNKILKFFIVQLNYELPTGRLSSIKFLENIIKKCPITILKRICELLFVSLATRLVNEDDSECRINTAQCIQDILLRLDDDYRMKLFNITILFFDGDKPAIREMAAVLCSRFIDTEKEMFLEKAKIIFPKLKPKLLWDNTCDTGKYVRNHNFNETNGEHLFEEVKRQENRANDHEIIQIQNCIMNAFTYCIGIFQDKDMQRHVNEIAYESQALLAHDHKWIRLNAVKILNKIISNININNDDENIESAKKTFFLRSIYSEEIKNVCLDLLAQLQPNETEDDMAQEVIEALLRITNILYRKRKCASHSEKEQSDKKSLNIGWLMKKICWIIQKEVRETPNNYTLRRAIFNWMEGVVALVDDKDLLNTFSKYIITYSYRELKEENLQCDKNVRMQVLRLNNKLKKRIGNNLYTDIYNNVQSSALLKRSNRKRIIAQEKIFDPLRAAKRKQSLQERKTILKRKKIVSLKQNPKRKKRQLEQDLFS